MKKNRKRQETTLENAINFVDKRIKADIRRLEMLVSHLERNCVFYMGLDGDVAQVRADGGVSFCKFMQGAINQLKRHGPLSNGRDIRGHIEKLHAFPQRKRFVVQRR